MDNELKNTLKSGFENVFNSIEDLNGHTNSSNEKLEDIKILLEKILEKLSQKES